MPFPPTRSRLLWQLLSLVLLFASPVAAHNGEEIPTPPVTVRLDEGRPPRWSWIHWWEANRFKYLDAPNQAPPDQKPTTSEFVKLREQVSVELIDALKSAKRENLIIECALALGKLQYEPALPVLQALIETSDSPKIQTAALVAIGLIGTPGAERILISFNPPKKEGRIAALAAIGLLPQLQGETLQQLRKAVLTEDPAVATVICWALRQHPHPENNQYFSDLLRAHKSPWVASEALLALGETRDRNKARLWATCCAATRPLTWKCSRGASFRDCAIR